uniref:Uncharacterized protein n=1 Tax=Oryza sativa subsp. japonica TaxID=39947 RepID=Q6AUJ6_ORYSJ|nr:unknown protein [Oryza sativa Japonica Group]
MGLPGRRNPLLSARRAAASLRRSRRLPVYVAAVFFVASVLLMFRDEILYLTTARSPSSSLPTTGGSAGGAGLARKEELVSVNKPVLLGHGGKPEKHHSVTERHRPKVSAKRRPNKKAAKAARKKFMASPSVAAGAEVNVPETCNLSKGKWEADGEDVGGVRRGGSDRGVQESARHMGDLGERQRRPGPHVRVLHERLPSSHQPGGVGQPGRGAVREGGRAGAELARPAVAGHGLGHVPRGEERVPRRGARPGHVRGRDGDVGAPQGRAHVGAHHPSGPRADAGAAGRPGHVRGLHPLVPPRRPRRLEPHALRPYPLQAAGGGRSRGVTDHMCTDTVCLFVRSLMGCQLPARLVLVFAFRFCCFSIIIFSYARYKGGGWWRSR